MTSIWILYHEEGDALGWHERTFLGAAQNKDSLKHLEGKSEKGEYGYDIYAYAQVPMVPPSEGSEAALDVLLLAAKKMLEAWECRAPAAGIIALQDAVAKVERKQLS